MLNLTLLQQMLVVAIALSVITCAFIQKTKKYFPCSSCLVIYNLVVNFVVGTLFCITFTSVDFPNSLWVSFFSFIGADTLYKSLEGKLKDYSSLVNTDYITVKKANIISTDMKGSDE